MPPISIKVKRISDNYLDVEIPKYETEGSSGLDIRAAIDSEQVIENGKIETFNAKNLFKCFGPGTFNSNRNLEEALRHEIRPQIEEYRRMLVRIVV